MERRWRGENRDAVRHRGDTDAGLGHGGQCGNDAPPAGHAHGHLPLARDLAAEYHWPRQATLRQSFSDFEEVETMIHLKPLGASFKTRTVS